MENLNTYSIASILDKNLARIDDELILLKLTEKLTLIQSFREIVGEFIFSNCSPSYSERNKKLWVQTNHPVIKIELMIRKPAILEALRKTSNFEVIDMIAYI